MIGQGIQEKTGTPARCAHRRGKTQAVTAKCSHTPAHFTTKKGGVFPFRRELFTFSTGFSTVFVKKKRSFQRCFPPFPHSFPHPVEESPIQAVMDAAAFWKFVGKNVGILPFIKKKVEGFSLHSTNRSRAAIYFSPIWNGMIPSFQHRAAAVFLCGKGGETCSFPHCFIPAEPSQSPAATIGSRLRGLDAKISPLGQTKCLRGLIKPYFMP